MSYVSKVLHKDEKVVCDAGYHWWFLFSGAFVRPLIAVLIIRYVVAPNEDIAHLVGIFYFMIIFFIIVKFIQFFTTERILTTQRLIVKNRIHIQTNRRN